MKFGLTYVTPGCKGAFSIAISIPIPIWIFAGFSRTFAGKFYFGRQKLPRRAGPFSWWNRSEMRKVNPGSGSQRLSGIWTSLGSIGRKRPARSRKRSKAGSSRTGDVRPGRRCAACWRPTGAPRSSRPSYQTPGRPSRRKNSIHAMSPFSPRASYGLGLMHASLATLTSGEYLDLPA